MASWEIAQRNGDFDGKLIELNRRVSSKTCLIPREIVIYCYFFNIYCYLLLFISLNLHLSHDSHYITIKSALN